MRISFFPSGSALMWADLAQQSIRYSDPVGYHLVQYWISEIDASNSDMENTSDPNPILKFFKTFAKMTGRLSTHINRNPALAHCFAIITRELGKLLKVKKDENTLDTLNSYMIDTYPRIKSAMNSK